MLLFFSCKIYSQTYSSYINKAENCITTSNLLNAIVLYDSAFTKVKYPFVKDIYNQIICAEKINQIDKVNEKIIFLMENYNVKLKYLKKIKKFIDKNQYELYQQRKNEKISNQKKIIDSLFKLDISFLRGIPIVFAPLMELGNI